MPRVCSFRESDSPLSWSSSPEAKLRQGVYPSWRHVVSLTHSIGLGIRCRLPGGIAWRGADFGGSGGKSGGCLAYGGEASVSPLSY